MSATSPVLPRPALSPSPDDQPFWEAGARGELFLPYCRACANFFFYPRTLCPTCGSRNIEWRRSQGRGSLYSFCIHHHTAIPELREALPFVTVLVTLDEGPRLMSFLIGVPASPDAIYCDMQLEVTFIEAADGRTIPAFRPTIGEAT